MVVGMRKLFVEGGGDRNPSLASECRKAFSRLFEKAGVAHKPRVIACGGRRRAYDQFTDAIEHGEKDVWLLVDAEEIPSVGTDESPWDHVKTRQGDGWTRPGNADDDQLHFMSVCMETWLIADPSALKEVFGPKLDESRIPAPAQLETTDKSMIYKALDTAVRPTKAGMYSKGSHSFRILEKVSPQAIRELSWGRRFLDAMKSSQ